MTKEKSRMRFLLCFLSSKFYYLHTTRTRYIKLQLLMLQLKNLQEMS